MPRERALVARRVILVAFAIAASCAILYAVFPDGRTFVAEIDDYRLLFADFVLQYHPAAHELVTTGHAYPGYYYPAFFAILLSPLGAAPISAALWVWGAVQVGTTAVLVRQAWNAARGPFLGAAAILVTLTSAPVLHAFKWGQISGLVVLAVLGALRLAWTGRSTFGGIVLAFATSLKFYPALAIAASLARRDARLAISWAGACAVLLLALPAAVLGPHGALQFHRDVYEDWSQNASRHAADPNSQSFTHVVERWCVAQRGALAPATSTPTALHTTLVVLGAGIAAALIALVVRTAARRAQVSHAETWTGLLILGAVPFIVPTAWPHYFAHLPIAQAFAGRELLQLSSRGRRGVLAAALLFPSIALGSIAPIACGIPWRTYVYLGGPFVASAAVTLLIVLILIPKLRAEDPRITSSAH